LIRYSDHALARGAKDVLTQFQLWRLALMQINLVSAAIRCS
jgi:hypothetical protein